MRTFYEFHKGQVSIHECDFAFMVRTHMKNILKTKPNARFYMKGTFDDTSNTWLTLKLDSTKRSPRMVRDAWISPSKVPSEVRTVHLLNS